jgi:DNA-directed RNA polymerase specialized sigma24 family protein
MSIHDLSQLSDAELIMLVRHGAENAFYVLRKRKNDKMLKAFFYHVLRDEQKEKEADQETWLSVFEELCLLNCAEIKDFDKWLRTIAYHKAMDTVRRNYTVSMDATESEPADDAPSELDMLIRSQLHEMLVQYIPLLPQYMQKVVTLYLQYKSFADIDRELGWSEGSASSIFTKAVKYLAPFFGTGGQHKNNFKKVRRDCAASRVSISEASNKPIQIK